jgi:uncharacterized protein (TIGR02145 family)
MSYGKLYNWYAVNDSRKIAPLGWHIASLSEWTSLITYLGGVNVAGGKLKEAGTFNWLSPNTGATNETGFTALPGSGRKYDGTFNYIHYAAGFWTSTNNDSSNAWDFGLIYNNSNIFSAADKYINGFSVRCVRD